MKDTSVRLILEVRGPVSFDDERILMKTKLLDSGYVRITQRHLGVHATLSASVMKAHVIHFVNHWKCQPSNLFCGGQLSSKFHSFIEELLS